MGWTKSIVLIKDLTYLVRSMWSFFVDENRWTTLARKTEKTANNISSYTFADLQIGEAYLLRLTDSGGDGTCCSHGFGWFTVTSSIPSVHHGNGTALWQTRGD